MRHLPRNLPRHLPLAILLLSSAVASAEDWPRWRGPRGDSISREAGLADRWPDDGPKQLWTAEVGLGYASPLAFEGKLYVFASLDEEKQNVLYCLNPADGKIIWKQATPDTYTGRGWPGSRASPVIDAGHIYTYGGGGQLICRNLADGKLLWQVDTLKETGGKILEYGLSSNPLIIGDRIYVQSGTGGASVLAVDKNTGAVAWKSEATGGGYATIIPADVEGATQLIAFGAKAIVGVNPANGATLWTMPWITDNDVNCTVPVYADGHLFISSADNHGSIMLKLSKAGAAKEWESKEILVRFGAPILEGDKLYINSSGTTLCLQWPTEKVIWSAREPRMDYGGTLVRIPGKRFIGLTMRGALSLLQETDDGLKIISEKKGAVEGKEVWAQPLIYQGKVFIKGETEVVGYEIGK